MEAFQQGQELPWRDGRGLLDQLSRKDVSFDFMHYIDEGALFYVGCPTGRTVGEQIRAFFWRVLGVFLVCFFSVG